MTKAKEKKQQRLSFRPAKGEAKPLRVLPYVGEPKRVGKLIPVPAKETPKSATQLIVESGLGLVAAVAIYLWQNFKIVHR